MTASRSSRRSARFVAGSVLLVGAAALTLVSACSAGQLAQTSEMVPSVPGVNANAGPNGEIALRDLLIAYNGQQGYPQGGDAPLVARIFNDGARPVKLVRVTADETARAVVLVGGAPGVAATQTAAATASTAASPSAAPSPGGSPSPSPAAAAPTPITQAISIDIAPYSYRLLVPGQGEYLMLRGLTRPLGPGSSVPVTFTFDDGSSVRVNVPFGVPTEPGPRVSATAHAEG